MKPPRYIVTITLVDTLGLGEPSLKSVKEDVEFALASLQVLEATRIHVKKER